MTATGMVGAKLPKMSLIVLTAKNQKTNCAKFLHVDRFCSQKSVNNVCKLLQLLEDFIPKPATGANPWRPLTDFRPQTTWFIARQIKISWPPLECGLTADQKCGVQCLYMETSFAEFFGARLRTCYSLVSLLCWKLFFESVSGRCSRYETVSQSLLELRHNCREVTLIFCCDWSTLDVSRRLCCHY